MERWFNHARVSFLLCSVSLIGLAGCLKQDIVAPHSGAVIVDVQPDGIGAEWTLATRGRTVATGVDDLILPDVPTGRYTLTWAAIEGWVGPSPNPMSFVVSKEEKRVVIGEYAEIPQEPGPIVVPAPTDWTDRGEIFPAGQPGDWDLYLWGGFAATAIKRDGVFHLYYQGSDGYDETEFTVTHRAIGVATSTDGIVFEKHAASPVITWSPNQGIEEGAPSAGAWVSDTGQVQIYYGANTEIPNSQVNADGRLATSADGLQFEDAGLVLDHAAASVWGYGDEIFPIIGFREGSTWYSYYIPNGSPQSGRLGVAWGPAPTSLTSTAQVTASGSAVPVWGPGAAIRLSDTSYAIFVSNRADAHFAGEHVDVYLMDPSSPQTLTGPVQTYAFANANKSTVLLDLESNTWFLYYRNADASAYRVRTAPVVRD